MWQYTQGLNAFQELDGDYSSSNHLASSSHSSFIPCSGSFLSFWFKSQIFIYVVKLVRIWGFFFFFFVCPSFPGPTLCGRRASVGQTDGRLRQSPRQCNLALGLESLRTASSDLLRRCPAWKAASPFSGAREEESHCSRGNRQGPRPMKGDGCIKR